MVKTVMRKAVLIMTAVTVLFCLSSYASGTCGVNGCYRSSVYGGTYCSNHTCSKYNCKNLAVDGGYCSEHKKKTYESSSFSLWSPMCSATWSKHRMDI